MRKKPSKLFRPSLLALEGRSLMAASIAPVGDDLGSPFPPHPPHYDITPTSGVATDDQVESATTFREPTKHPAKVTIPELIIRG